MPKSKYVFWTIIVLLLFALTGCLKAGYKDLEPGEAKKLIDENPMLFIMDVREPYEYAEVRIPGSHNIPMGEVEQQLPNIDKEQEILVVCETGSRSASIAQMLVSKGYKHVYNLKGGIANWPYELEK
ncbi:rhodanese-like domain-containing protein [Carboxydothermus islandicus]|uniref:Rhodanese-like domain-containing protein n=1 Tax=Carboxydothermus islandicus TaxID=661089 RepID=A0A1L8CZU1_9THEO|nr:rhodanese-like domain-containing protein [Carboxydothermus islandicus]GAV24428.1 rhodanese-like domain-containing protein [Carboxydothermus islandicus]